MKRPIFIVPDATPSTVNCNVILLVLGTDTVLDDVATLAEPPSQAASVYLTLYLLFLIQGESNELNKLNK